MQRSVKRRLALAGAATAIIGSAATLVAGFNFGLFSASEASGANTFTAGTVSVALGTPTSVTCTITDVVPGDSSAGAPIGTQADTTCTYNVKYTGSVGAWLAVDVNVTNGAIPLYDGTATGLQFYLNDATPTTYVTSAARTSGTTFTEQGGASVPLPAGTTSNLLVSSTAAAANTEVSFSLDYALPIASGASYQGGSTAQSS